MVGHKQNGDPIFRYVLAKTQKELLAKLHRDMDLYQDAQLTEDSRMTLGDYLDRFPTGSGHTISDIRPSLCWPISTTGVTGVFPAKQHRRN